MDTFKAISDEIAGTDTELSGIFTYTFHLLTEWRCFFPCDLVTKSQIEGIISGKAHKFETGGFCLWEDLHCVLDVQLLTSMEVGWTIHMNVY